MTHIAKQASAIIINPIMAFIMREAVYLNLR